MFTIRCVKDTGSKAISLLHKTVFCSHGSTCPAKPDAGGGGLTRAEKSAKCRYGFIPENWFLFFHSKTGVSGPYVLGIVLANYCFSKEILVMEHEFYGGLSWIIVLYFTSTRFGPQVGAILDKEVDAVVDEWDSGRKMEIASHEEAIKGAKQAQWMAEGQKQLMDAKKENVAMQLEAIYRERYMFVYRSVKGRMDYHVKRYYSEARIHQRWMVSWILREVKKSITPEFEKRALDQAIADLEAAASRAG